MTKSKSKKSNETPTVIQIEPSPKLVWLKAIYHFHSFAYRDPRSAFSSGTGLPVVSPTAVLLGITSALFSLGEDQQARAFLDSAHLCKVVVDPPQGAIFFRTFHQLRRYHSNTKGRTERVGFTNINQGTREYALPQGNMVIFVGVPEAHVNSASLALSNRDHVGTHDSLCSLVGSVEICDEPKDVIYIPIGEKFEMPERPFTVVTLSRFNKPVQPTVGESSRGHWWMAGGDDTELVPYLIKGSFRGTTRGKIYIKS